MATVVHNIKRISVDMSLVRNIENHSVPFDALTPGTIVVERLKDNSLGAFLVKDFLFENDKDASPSAVTRVRIFPKPFHESARALRAESYRTSGRLVTGRVREGLYESFFNRADGADTRIATAAKESQSTPVFDMEPLVGDLTRITTKLGTVLERFGDFVEARAKTDHNLLTMLKEIHTRSMKPDWATAHASRLVRAAIRDLRLKGESDSNIAEILSCSVPEVVKWGGKNTTNIYTSPNSNGKKKSTKKKPSTELFFPQY